MFAAHGQSTQHNPGPPVQRNLALMAEMPKPRKVEAALLKNCDNLLDAVILCIQLSHLPHNAIARKLGIDKGHWTRMMQAQAHFPTNKLKMLMELCGNYAPMQWLAASTGFELFEDAKAKRKEELRRELEELENVA
jgi:hypothetical protein